MLQLFRDSLLSILCLKNWNLRLLKLLSVGEFLPLLICRERNLIQILLRACCQLPFHKCFLVMQLLSIDIVVYLSNTKLSSVKIRFWSSRGPNKNNGPKHQLCFLLLLVLQVSRRREYWSSWNAKTENWAATERTTEGAGREQSRASA